MIELSIASVMEEVGMVTSRLNRVDGTPDMVKAVCPVWGGGKGGDNFKALPIAITEQKFARAHRNMCREYI